MIEYPKIDTVFKRDMEGKDHRLLPGQWSKPEFMYLKDNVWECTEKVDGTNIRIMWDGVEVKIGGRTSRAQLNSDLYEVLSRTFTADKMLEAFSDTSVCLYGEGYGAGIQGCGGLYRPDKSFVLFDVLIGEWWLLREDVDDIADRLDIMNVPIVGQGTLQDAIDLVQAGFISNWGNFLAEGVVCRPALELFNRAGKRIITKIKHRDFFAQGEAK